MNRTYLLIGSNEGDRIHHMSTAREMVKDKIGKITASSQLYETAAWGKHDQPDFLNQVLLVNTLLPAATCLKEILLIEKRMGRIRTKKNDPRIIDIDILFFNDDIINDVHLSVAHPELQNRKFVLIPMNELSPGLIHPVLHRSMRDLLSTCKDELEVRVFQK